MSGDDFRRFAAALRMAAGGLEKRAKDSADRAAQGALATARAHAPVDSGALRSSLRVRSRGGEIRAVVEATDFKARFQEFGTSRMAPNPFIQPAFAQWEPIFVRDLEKVVDDMAGEL